MLSLPKVSLPDWLLKCRYGMIVKRRWIHELRWMELLELFIDDIKKYVMNKFPEFINNTWGDIKSVFHSSNKCHVCYTGSSEMFLPIKLQKSFILTFNDGQIHPQNNSLHANFCFMHHMSLCVWKAKFWSHKPRHFLMVMKVLWSS